MGECVCVCVSSYGDLSMSSSDAAETNFADLHSSYRISRMFRIKSESCIKDLHNGIQCFYFNTVRYVYCKTQFIIFIQIAPKIDNNNISIAKLK